MVDTVKGVLLDLTTVLLISAWTEEVMVEVSCGETFEGVLAEIVTP